MKFVGIVQLDDGVWVSIIGTVGPFEFFKSLRSVDSPQGTTFLNDSGEVQSFPSRMTILLRIIGPVTPNGRSLAGKKLNYDQMRWLRFKAQWKRGLKLRDVRDLQLHIPWASSYMDVENPELLVNNWTYEMVLEDSQVPITDHLVLYILTPENKLIARMSAYL